MLDAFGTAHFVAHPGMVIPQDFFFPEDSQVPEGRAVDLEMTRDQLGFWVLTDFGGIFRAGTAKDPGDPAQVPDGEGLASILGWDMPLTGSARDRFLPDPGGATRRAVAFIPFDLEGDTRAEGYLILDSVGGRYHLDGAGNAIPNGFADATPAGDPRRLLDPSAYSWPIFTGLDIARDMEAHHSLSGLIIFDGWGGIHPVPVNIESNPVFFARNEVSLSDPTHLQDVGMPYVNTGFDDPMTAEVDEGDPELIGIDAASIFTDLEFSLGYEGGLYTLDKFGAVFALGAARLDPLQPVHPFSGAPYFYPFLFAEDIEILPAAETAFESELFDCPPLLPTLTPTITPTPTITQTPTITPTPTNSATPTPTSTLTLIPTVTHTPTVTLTRTPTSSFTPANTRTPTHSPTITLTPTITKTPTITLTPTITNTPTPTDPPLILQVDLDRYQEGVQTDLLPDVYGERIRGAVVFTGGGHNTFIGNYSVRIDLQGPAEILSSQSITRPGAIPDQHYTQVITDNLISRVNLAFYTVPVTYEPFPLFEFDIALKYLGNGAITFRLRPTDEDGAVGVSVNMRTLNIGTHLQTTESELVYDPLPTFTPAPACADSGLYVLDAFGGRHRVGSAPAILGPLYYGRDVAVDLEPVGNSTTLVPPADLAVLDRFGAVQFVANPGTAPQGQVYFPEGSDPSCGFAVDVEMSKDGQGFYLLTEAGGIFRAGTARPDGEPAQLGGDAALLCETLNIPFGDMRAVGYPAHDNASIRAVALAAVQPNDGLLAFIVIDSQGGHYLFDESGDTLDGEGMLSAQAAYPFFEGLDIVRDIELHPAVNTGSGEQALAHGLVILDGFGGVHPVPVSFRAGSSVSFVRNISPAEAANPGLPFVPAGFDDPTTPENEGDPSLFGPDANSIFRDIEFCTGGDGLYLLDAYGAVFAFGSTRLLPNTLDPRFTGLPYFFPNLYARDLEPSP